MKKVFIILFTILVLGAIAFSVYFIRQSFLKPVEIKEIKSYPFEAYLNSQKKTFSQSKDWYQIDISYPEKSKTISDQIFDQMNTFVKENELEKFKNIDEAKAELGLSVEGTKYSFSADYRVATSTETITYIYTLATYTGGAHGGVQIIPITINTKGETMNASQVLPDNLLAKVSDIAAKEIVKQKRERLKEYKMTQKEIDEYIKGDTFVKEGVAPTRDNYSSVWFEGEDLVVHFGQYQVGPYAEGMYEVRINKSELK